MSFDDLHSSLGSASPSGQPAAHALVDVEKISTPLVSENEEITTDDIELLARLDSANTVASGMETRLDDILDALDDLLTSLEPKTADDSQEATGPKPSSEIQFKHPPIEQS